MFEGNLWRRGSGYSAAYDAAGNMTCRAPSSATTCSGTQTGQQLSYDAEGNLSTWQNQPTPTSTVNYLYDGEGTRVASQLVSSGNTTLTSYIGQLETVVTGSSTTMTTYYTAGALRIAEAVNGTFSYLGNDVLGSTAVALNASGQLTAAQLYGPYGNVRYSSGTMPTDIGFTGQRGDSVTGLDYYNARYYDPVVGLFISADTVLPGNGYDPWGLSRYAYVRGNPETMTDPTGHRVACGSNCGSGGPPTPNDCNADPSLCDSGSPPPAPPPQHGHVPAGNGNNGGPTPTPGQGHKSPPNHAKKSQCLTICGGVKDGGLLARGILDAGIGGGILAAAIAGLSNAGWTAGLGVGFFLSWLGQGLSDLLYGAREFVSAFSQVSPAILFALDLVKTIVDVGTAIINVVNIGNILRGPGPGLGFLNKLSYFGQSIGNLFKGLAAPTATLMSRTANLVSSSYQLLSPQLGVANTIGADWNNLTNDWSAIQNE